MDTVSTPDVSLILPIYNAGKYLAPCLESCINQTLANIEIICVNDGSKDDSLATMQDFASRDDRITVIDKQNGGYGCANNAGMRKARGTYIAIIEPDDYIDSRMCEDLVTFARAFEQLPDIVKSAFWRVRFAESADETIVYCSYYKRLKIPHQPFALKDCPELIQHHPSIWSAFYRRDFLVENDIWFHEIPGAGWADNPWLIDTFCRAKSIVYLDKPYYFYREDLPGSSSVLKTYDLPFDRWNDMTDILEELGVEDEGILRAHYHRGLTYFNGILEDTEGMDNPKIVERAREMFARMKPEIVLSMNKLSPATKAMFIQLRGLPEQKLSKSGYYRSLADEFFYTIRINGIGFAIARIKRYMSQRAARMHSDRVPENY